MDRVCVSVALADVEVWADLDTYWGELQELLSLAAGEATRVAGLTFPVVDVHYVDETPRA